MKKLNLIVIGLGLFAMQPLHGMATTGVTSANPLVAARQAVEVAEVSTTADSIQRARAAIARIPSKDRAIKNRLTARVDKAAKRVPGAGAEFYGPAMEGIQVPRTPSAMSSADFDAQLRALEADVASLRSQWNASSGGASYTSNIEGYY